MLLEQEILRNHRSHATGTTELRGGDRQVKHGEQEVLHSRVSVGQTSRATQRCPIGDSAPELAIRDRQAVEGRAVDAVAIPMDPARCRVVRKNLDDLLRSPVGGRMRRRVDMDDVPSMVGEHQYDEEHPSRERRDREAVHRGG